MADHSRFPIRFTGAGRGMAAFGLSARNSYVDITPSELVVRMGRGFRATIPRTSVGSVTEDHDRVLGWGAHGWSGVWLINGSSTGIVRIEIDPAPRGFVAGFPVRVRVLRVALEDPVGFCSALHES